MRPIAVCCCLLIALAGAVAAADFAPTRTGEIQGVLDSMEYDSAGNCYVLGNFSGALDFDPAAGTQDLKTSAGLNDIFVTCFRANGSYAWTQIFGGSGNEDALDLKLTTTHVFVCGNFTSLNAGIGAAGALAANGPKDGFVLSLALSNGSPNLSFGAGGVVVFTGSDSEGADAIAFAPNGNLYVTGTFDSLDFGIDTFGVVMSVGLEDVFVAVLNSAGAPVTSFNDDAIQTFGGSSSEFATDILIANSLVYVCGNFSSASASINGVGSTGTAGLDDFFILSIDLASGFANESFQGNGIQTFGGTSADFAYSMAFANNVLYVVGDVGSTDAGFDAVAGSFGPSQAFTPDWGVIALNPASGAPISTFGQAPGGFQQFGGTGTDNSSDMAAIGSNIYLVGLYQSTDAGVGTAGGGLNSQIVPQGAIVALSAANGTALSSFDNDGVIEPFKPTNSYAYHSTSDGTNLAVGGQFSFEQTSYILRFNPTTGAAITGGGGGGGGGKKPPKQALTTFLATPNPAAVNQSVAFTADISLKGSNKTATLDFGDGTPALTLTGDSLVDSLKNGVLRTYTVEGAYEARLTISSSTQTETGTLFMLVGNNTQVNPVSGMSSTIVVSPGQLNGVIDISRVPGAVNVSTNFTESLGREIIEGQFFTRSSASSGIIVADSTATDAGGFEKARVRKTVAVSSRNAQESGPNDEPPSADIRVKKFTGSFVFTGGKTDKIGFNAELSLPATFQPAVKGATAEGLLIHVGIGNVLDSIRVDAKGKALTASTSGRLKKFKISFPKTSDKPAKISGALELVNASAAGFDTEGISAELRTTETNLIKKGVSRSIQFAVVIDGISYNTLAPVLFKLATDTESGKFVSRKTAR